MRRHPRTLVPTMLVALLPLAALAACSDDDPGAGSEVNVDGEAPTTSAEPATSEAPEETDEPEPAESTEPADTEAPDETDAAATTAAPDTTVAATSPPAAAAGEDPAVSFTVIADLDSPVDLAWRPGDDGLYVVEQRGQIERVAPDGSTTTVLDATDLTEEDGERGLLGLTFSPSGELAYTNYTDNDGNTTIAEYPVEPDGTFLDGDNARTLFVIEQPYANHNGGDVVFGPDGMLYIGMGDGGDRNDPERRATDLSSPLGKLLRIDPTPSGDEPYTVPADNPYVGDGDADPRIWSSGLRNPWRFSFDRTTGDLWIADVGQGEIEEIDAAPSAGGVDAGKGLSFGWSAFEGEARFNDDVSEEGHVGPFFTYDHSGGNCSVSGGVRAREASSLDGWYVFADFCSGDVTALEVLGEGESLSPGRTVSLGNVGSPTAIVDGPNGELYVLSRSGNVSRLDPA